MKKVLAFVLIATSIISLASCGKKNKLPASYTTIPAPTETTAKEETEEKTTEAATSEEVGETEVATSEETSETETTTSEETGESEEDELPEDEDKISEELQEILESYKDENGYMPPDEDILLEAEHKVYEYAQKLEEAGEIEGCAYCDEGYSVSFFLNDGTTTVYAPELQDYYSDGEDFQVYIVDSFMGFQNINAAINFTHPGKTIKKVFPATSYTDYNSSTTIADIKLFMGALSENNVRAVFWRSHGSYYTDKNGTTRSVLGTSEKLSKRNKEYYKEDLEADRLLTFTSGHYAITKHFIETYLYPVRGGLFFTQSCHGTSDGGDLGRAFIEKGFDAYVGGNGSIYIPYGSGIMSATADYLCKKDENGQYYTIREALDLAEKDYKYSFSEMNNDGVLGEGARFYIVGDNDFRLVHTESNRISRSSEAPTDQNSASETTTNSAESGNKESKDSSSNSGFFDDAKGKILNKLQGIWRNQYNLYRFDGNTLTEYVSVGDKTGDYSEWTYVKKGDIGFNIELTDYWIGNNSEKVYPADGDYDFYGFKLIMDDRTSFWYSDLIWSYLNSDDEKYHPPLSYYGEDYYWEAGYQDFDLWKDRPSDGNTQVNILDVTLPSNTVEFNGHYYCLYKEGTVSDSNEAISFCQKMGGHLATITSAEENAFLYSYILSQGCDSAYFGLTDSEAEGTWKWSNGESIDYMNWGIGEANDQDENEDWAMFYYKFTDGTWNDGVFAENSAFICEWGN